MKMGLCMEPHVCWERGRQCGSASNISDGEEPLYEYEKDTQIWRERERDRHKRRYVYSK